MTMREKLTEKMIFTTSEQVREHLKKVSLKPEYSILVLISISGIISWVASMVIAYFYEMSFYGVLPGTMFLAITTMIVFVLLPLGKIQIKMGHKGIPTFLDKRRFEERYPRAELCILEEGTHWGIPGLCGAISVSFEEDSISIEKAIAKVPIDPVHKTGKFKTATFVDIEFSEGKLQFMVSDPYAFTNVGAAGLKEDLTSAIGEAIRDFAITTTTKAVYEAGVNGFILDNIKQRKTDGVRLDTERWGILPLAAFFPKIDPENPKVKEALEGQYLEALNKIKEVSEAQTLAEIFRKLKGAAKGASDEFVMSVAIRIVEDLTKIGQDVFIHNHGSAGNGSVDGALFGIGAAVLNQSNQNRGGTPT
ncbi:MAG: hypothetical protein WC087_00430 [Candidatus Paceibacterota bacterium]